MIIVKCSGPASSISVRSTPPHERADLTDIRRQKEAVVQSDFMAHIGPIEKLHSLDASEAASEQVALGSDYENRNFYDSAKKQQNFDEHLLSC